MKILNVIPVFPPAEGFGGPLVSTYEMSRELVKRGHDVTVYTTNAFNPTSNFIPPSKPYILNGIKVYYFRNFIRTNRLFISPSLLTSLQRNINDFDLIFIHSWRGFQDLITSSFAILHRVPYVIKTGGSLPRMRRKKILKILYDIIFGFRILKKSNKVIAVNLFEAEQFKGMNVSEEKIAIIPNGIDYSKYMVTPPKGVFKRKFSIREEDKIVLYLGRLHKIKGIDILIKSFSKLLQSMNNVILVIVGSDDGSLYDIQKLVNDLKIEEKVIFTGALYGVDKLEAYIDADVYVLPSRYEIFGLTVLEAYSCGKPVIASRVGGLKDLVIDGVTGLLFTSEDTVMLTESIFIILNDITKAKQMGDKGKKYVKENFTIVNVVDKLECIYYELALKMRTQKNNYTIKNFK